ncbi:hypothetical protein FNV43_RR24678 [Rhamnella rubrinervis]|uniref:Uncharacterized protein n=1 Tax=Rhamnella rubrinervis TaxID=2594499 RepID=A0A8K0DRN3_9ROSA|nr:hypothetical protein FNV43_RR24678 [Rhamnella rubrinervis]
MDTCLIPASQQEQYIDLEIPLQHIHDWLRDGYSYMHFGAIRIILTAHARQWIPTAVKMALLNSIFPKYEHAIIGTIFTILNPGSSVATAYAGTLHHQVVYRLENHALNLPGPSLQGLPLLITTKRDDIASIIHTPKQIAPEALKELIPLEWFTRYEQLHKTSTPLVFMDPSFQSMTEGTVQTSFGKPSSEASSSRVLHTLMITPASQQCNPNLEKDIPIVEFNTDGSLTFVSHIDGHFIWDVALSMCHPDYDCNNWSDDSDDECYSFRRRKKKHTSRYLEFLFSEQEQEDEQTTLVIQSSQPYYSDSEDTDSSYVFKLMPPMNLLFQQCRL